MFESLFKSWSGESRIVHNSCVLFIADIRHWDRRLVLEHVYGEGNQAVDFLAKLGAKSMESV